MASFLQLSSSISLLFLLLPLLISPAYSQKCTSQTFKGKTHYANCTDLPALKSYLHWTYDPNNSTLSIAFIAPPAKSDGWVAWAINPTATGMVGSQAFLAYKASNGSLFVKTYNISSYSSIVESKLSFDVLDKRADFSGGLMRIFARMVLPESMTTVNQVWQVGSSVKNGVPEKHAFDVDNLKANGTLELVKAEAESSAAPAPAPSLSASGPSPSTSGRSPSGAKNDTGGCGRAWNGGFLGFYVFLLVVGIFGFGF